MDRKVEIDVVLNGATEAAEAFERLATALERCGAAIEAMGGKHGGIKFKMAGPRVTCDFTSKGPLTAREAEAFKERIAKSNPFRRAAR